MKTILKKLVTCFLLLLSLAFITSCDKPPIDNGEDPMIEEPTKPNYDFSSKFKQDIISRETGVKKEWNKVSNYISNYGQYDEKMSEFDVAIINDRSLSDEDIQSLSAAGTYVIAYVSLGEDSLITYSQNVNYNDYYILDNIGKPTVNKDWNYYYVDARKLSWQNKVVTKVESLVARGVDGILMDNLEVVEMYPETKDGMITLIRLIKRRFPNLKLIAKNGFDLLPSLSSILSGVLVEEFCSIYDLDTGKALMKNDDKLIKCYEVAVEQINELRKYNYFPVFALDYVNEYEYDYQSQIYYNLCWELDFISYCTYDYSLSTLCNPKAKITTSRGVKALDTKYQIQKYQAQEFNFLPLFKKEVIEREENKQKPWNYVSSFICYYGLYDEGLTNFDVAIIDARWWSKENVKELSNAGTYVISYVSVGEDDSLNFDSKGNYCDYYIFDKEGKPTENGNWNSYFVDARKESWQVNILDKVRVLYEKGVDGIFMDTIDTAVAFRETESGMVSLIRRIKKEFPTIKLVANRGFELLPSISSSISGLMYEDFCSGYDFTNKVATVKNEAQLQRSYQRAINVVNEVRKYNYFPVFALDYVNEYEFDSRSQQYYDICWKYDFIPYCTYRILLDKVCIPNVELTTDRGINALE